MTHAALAVADYMLSSGKGFTPIQILKLVYIAHGWSLGLRGTPLIRERIEAWKHGPVIPSLYHEFKKFGSGIINKLAYCNTETTDTKIVDRRSFFDNVFSVDEKNIMDQVVNKYGYLTGNQLINLTHEKGTPWRNNFKKNNWFVEIPEDEIKSHYMGLANIVKS
ncbi:MAG: hypothetical protein K8823_888 [Cenarchaeum symbiont of Oopsacas minuta]|nr:hypothetical protein [Cenarchaeum symbiont of Oopsacas minuta]